MSRNNQTSVILSCEHAGNEIFPGFEPYFAGYENMLQTHEGYDPGAFEIATQMAQVIKAPLLYHKVSRLLVEVNRSEGHPQLFSKISKGLTAEKKAHLIKSVYHPYRDGLKTKILEQLNAGFEVIHLSIHSFTPELNGSKRTADLGILFDPEREAELEISNQWIDQIQKRTPEWVVKSNYPYLGVDDGVCTWLRTILPKQKYAGIEVEVNQKIATQKPEETGSLLAESFRTI